MITADTISDVRPCIDCRGAGSRIPYTDGIDHGCPTCGVLEPLTADTITDEQIRELSTREWATHAETCNNLRATANALGHSGIFDGVDCRMSHGNEAMHIRAARARCAEILNARANGGAK